MAERMTRSESWSYAELVLQSGEVAAKGEMACLDTTTGEVVVGQASTTLTPIGYFEENLTGDGTRRVRVRFFREIWLHWWDNDEVDTVTTIGSNCYIVDGRTVGATDGTGTLSLAGKVWSLSERYGVLVEMAG